MWIWHLRCILRPEIYTTMRPLAWSCLKEYKCIPTWLYGNSLITIYNIYFRRKERKTSEVPNQRKGWKAVISSVLPINFWAISPCLLFCSEFLFVDLSVEMFKFILLPGAGLKCPWWHIWYSSESAIRSLWWGNPFILIVHFHLWLFYQVAFSNEFHCQH